MSNLRAELTALYNTHGRLTPAMVVDAARAADHPLHSRFEWDDHAAAEGYRRVQAADLIRSVKVEWIPGAAEPVRAFHSITRTEGSSYEPIEQIAADDISTAILLRQAERDWKTLQRRYQHLDAFLRMVREQVA